MARELPPRPAQAGAALPSSGLGDLVHMLWRERGFMLAVFLLCFLVLGVAAFLALPTRYTAHTSLLVRLDEAYAYNPVLGQAQAGGSFGIDQIIQSEANILRADLLKRRTLERLGLRHVYPDLAEDYVSAPAGAARERVIAQAVRRVNQNLGVGAAPGAANIDATFRHERPETAAQFLNALVQEYLAYRPDVLLAFSSEGYRERRDEYEARLAGASAAMEAFLLDSGIGDFESYRTSLQQRQSEVDAGLFAARADREQASAQLSNMRTRISQLPAEIEQYVDSDASGRLLDLMLERVELLSRYTEEAVPVRELDARIAEMSAFIAAGGAEGAGARRVGPNPVRQELMSAEAQLSGQAAALDRRVAELTRQRAELQAEQLRVQNLAPQYERLNRDISSLQETVNRIANRQEESRAQRDLAAGALDNVTIVQPAVQPAQGASLKRPAFAGAFIVSGLIALLAGLGRGLLRGGPGLGFVPPWATVGTQEERRPRPARAPRQTKAPRPVHAAPAAPAASRGRAAPPAESQDPAPDLPVLAVVQRRAPIGGAPVYG